MDNTQGNQVEVSVKELSVLKAKLLLLLWRNTGAPTEAWTVTELAGALNVSKSTVSRAVASLEQKGVVNRADGRAISLTGEGKRLCKKLKQRIEEARLWLESVCAACGATEDDVILSAIYLPEKVVDAASRYAALYRLADIVGEYAVLDGHAFCHALGDGRYPVSVMCYRADSKGACRTPSMANKGFEKNGELVIENRCGKVILRAKRLEHQSASGVGIVSGKLDALKYQVESGFKTVEKEKDGDLFILPADAMNFVCACGRVIQGGVKLKMSCTAGAPHMPESEGVLAVYLRS